MSPTTGSSKKASKLLFVQTLIDIKSILNSVGFSDYYIENHLDKYHYIIHKINEQQAFRLEESSYSILNYENLQRVLGGNYVKQVLDHLFEWGIIETDNHYIKGSKSKGYRITNKYQSKTVGLFIMKDQFEAKLERLRARHITDYTKPAQYIYSCIKQIKIHRELSVEYINRKYNNSMILLKEVCYSNNSLIDIIKDYNKKLNNNNNYFLMPTQSKQLKEYDTDFQQDTAYTFLQNYLTRKHNLDSIAIEKIANKNFDVQQPDLTSRLFTVLTSLSKGLRSFLYYKDETLVNIDIRNSQPFLFNILLNDHYSGKKKPADVELYIKLTSTGKFYEYVMEALNVPLEERDLFKKIFFGKVFFCTEYYASRTEEGQYFQNAFPNVCKLVNFYKSIEKNYLPLEMQKAEANIILQKVVLKLAAKRIWCSTIHDSVVVREKDVEQVTAIMLKAFQDEHNLTPLLNPEAFQLPKEEPVIETITAPVTAPEPEVIITIEAQPEPQQQPIISLKSINELPVLTPEEVAEIEAMIAPKEGQLSCSDEIFNTL